MFLSAETNRMYEVVISGLYPHQQTRYYPELPENIMVPASMDVQYLAYYQDRVLTKVVEIAPGRMPHWASIMGVTGETVLVCRARKSVVADAGAPSVYLDAVWGTSDKDERCFKTVMTDTSRTIVIDHEGALRRYSVTMTHAGVTSRRVIARTGDRWIKATQCAGGVQYRTGLCTKAKDGGELISVDKMLKLLDNTSAGNYGAIQYLTFRSFAPVE